MCVWEGITAMTVLVRELAPLERSLAGVHALIWLRTRSIAALVIMPVRPIVNAVAAPATVSKGT